MVSKGIKWYIDNVAIKTTYNNDDIRSIKKKIKEILKYENNRRNN